MFGIGWWTRAPLFAALAAIGSANAQELAPGERIEEEPVTLDEVVVTVTRSPTEAAAVSGAVTIVPREQLQQQAELSGSVSDALSKIVPGLGPPTHSMSLQGQTLRGRKVLVLIDGVPQNVVRDGLRNLTTIHPSAIERIEVVPGATAIYGESASGGVINIVTRAPGAGPLRLETELAAGTAPVRPGAALGGSLRQAASGTRGAFDYSLSAAFERVGGWFDASGDRVPPDVQGNLSDSNSRDVLGKLGWRFAGTQRLQLTLNRFDHDQDTTWAIDPAVKAQDPGTQKATARDGLDLDEQQGTRNTVASLDWQAPQLPVGNVHAQVYFRDYLTRYGPNDSRTNPAVAALIQSRLESQKLGARLDVTSPLPKLAFATPRLLWGADYSLEQTSQPADIFDPEAYDASGGLDFDKVDEKLWVPMLKPRDLGLFAQLEAHLAWPFVVRAGVRHERVSVEVPDFTTIVGNPIQGGTLRLDDWLFNAGVVWLATDAVSVFANFSQGFSLTDLGLMLRQAPAGFEVEGSQLLDAQRVDSWEAGVRGAWQTFGFAATGFYNESELGTTIRRIGESFVPTRAPERVYGFDLAMDVSPVEGWRTGATASWSEGENDVDLDGDYLALDGFRIPPLKVTAYVEHDTVPRWRWRNRVQALWSGSRDRAFRDLGGVAFGGREVDDYVVLDLASSIAIRRGTLSLGVENLLNQQYFPVVAQLVRTGDNTSYLAARGATVRLGYAISY
jgi:iron complex outermembrane recepter protein